VRAEPQHVTIVGASLAGANVAVGLRDEGFDGAITMVGEEPRAPYERPPLSKGLLRGETSPEDANVKPPSFYRDAGIDLRSGVRAERVDVASRSVHLASGEALPFDRLVMTTGGRPKRPSIPGIDLAGIHTLRTIDDALAIRGDVGSARHAVIVGLGFIGSEVAASLRASGMDVTAIEGAATALDGPLGRQVGQVVEGMHRDHGVRLVLGDGVSRFDGTDMVERVVTSSGRIIEADLVVVGLGMQPNVEPVLGTSVEVSNGIVVDGSGRTSIEGIYAAGDVANHWHPIARRHLRVEHWTNAVKQGRAVARVIAGRGQPYDDIPYFWSEHYGTELQYYGLHGSWDDIVIRGDLDGRDFLAMYRSENRVVGAVAMGRPAELNVAKQLIASRAVVPRARLRDEDLELGTIELTGVVSAA
jgi:3-phenylpropionate/trans-cinnamate dioxygenase ferredoxin reductase subunit